MEKNCDLILTGWGYAEYVAAAAAALKALGGNAEVKGVSRRRLPELLAELAEESGAPRWRRIFLLGLSLGGNPEMLADALAKLKVKGVEVVWISGMAMPSQIADLLEGLLEVRFRKGTLLEAVGEAFKTDVKPLMPFARDMKRPPADVRDYLMLIAAAQFHYRNYQDESFYAKAV